MVGQQFSVTRERIRQIEAKAATEAEATRAGQGYSEASLTIDEAGADTYPRRRVGACLCPLDGV